MSIDLESAVPWGRNLSEYTRMFSLTPRDLRGRILDAAAGPSSFNAELRAMGMRATSTDPLYVFCPQDIRRRIDETYSTIVEGCRRDSHRFVWGEIRDPDHLGQVRMAAMAQFLDDLPRGKSEGRYLPQSLPSLSFADQSFDLALCSHFLFLYTEQLGLDFHLAALTELRRVAREIRIFPLLDLASRRSAHLIPALKHHPGGRVVSVGYEFQRGANEMLIIGAASSLPSPHPPGTPALPASPAPAAPCSSGARPP
jgi:hypothetical protein